MSVVLLVAREHSGPDSEGWFVSSFMHAPRRGSGRLVAPVMLLRSAPASVIIGLLPVLLIHTPTITPLPRWGNKTLAMLSIPGLHLGYFLKRNKDKIQL